MTRAKNAAQRGRPLPAPVAPLSDAEQTEQLFSLASQLVVAASKARPADAGDDAQRPAKRHRTETDSDSGARYITVSRCSISLRKTRPEPTKPVLHPARGPILAGGLVHAFVDGDARLYLSQPVGKGHRRLDGLLDRTLTTREQFFVRAVTKCQTPALKDRCQAPLFLTVAYDDASTDQDQGFALGVTLTLDMEFRWLCDAPIEDRAHKYEADRAWRLEALAVLAPHALAELGVDASALDGPRDDRRALPWTPQSFYEAAHVTSPDDSGADDLHVPGLLTRLFPFQRRAVRWLLQREGVCWAPDSDGRLVAPYAAPFNRALTSHFVRLTDAFGDAFYVSDLFGVVTRDPETYWSRFDDTVRGGILAEEMGLGKTVEVISLVLLHRRRPDVACALETRDGLVPGGTLIIAPVALKTQWVDELKRHAPGLRVLVYRGMAGRGVTKEQEADLVAQFAAHDVVVATYSGLRSEIHFALAPPARNMRSGTTSDADRPRSPLVQVCWWRVCLDEAQAIEGGASNVSMLAQVIPRHHSWGVTGTPVKDKVDDLHALMGLLRYQPYGSHPKIWKGLLRHHGALFNAIFGTVALRHTKQAVGHELTLPPQTRYVIKMPLTAVEEQHYESLFAQLCAWCGLTPDGAPASHGWSPDDRGVVEAMRTALAKLRLACLHPELNGHTTDRRAAGQRVVPMRTVVEVLDAMLDQSAAGLLQERRALLGLRLRRGQLLENSPRAREALAVWEAVRADAETLVAEARATLAVETQNAQDAGQLAKTNRDDRDAYDNKNKNDDKSDDDDDDDNAGGRLGDARRDLRYALEVLHKAEFFCGNGYFQVKTNTAWTKPGSAAFRALEKKETESYDRARRIRREILRDNLARATEFMRDLEGRAAEQAFVEIPECTFVLDAGLESRRTADDLDALAAVLSQQAAQMDTWREALVQLLLKGLVDDDEDKNAELAVTGDEYEDSTRVQDEVQAYLTIVKAGISDRRMLLTGVAPSGLAVHEETQAFRMAKNGDGPAPALMLRLLYERKKSLLPPGVGADTNEDEDAESDADSVAHLEPFVPDPERRLGKDKDTLLLADYSHVTSLRACLYALRETAGRLRTAGTARSDAELALVEQQLRAATAEQGRQLQAVADLERELGRLRRSLNARIAYYRQLQIVSDMVALYEGPRDDAALAAARTEEAAAERRVAVAASKHRYLEHLKQTDATAESQMCVICQASFSVGVLTVCGHQFCKECLTLWYNEHRNCPLCKRVLTRDHLHDITLKRRALKVVDDGPRPAKPTKPAKPASRTRSKKGRAKNGQGGQNNQENGEKGVQIYAEFSADRVAEIMDVDLPGPSYTTKIDTLVRHLLWLRHADPGAKSIVFSQYQPFLDILGDALRHYGINYTTYAGYSGIDKFKTDASVECFLLHARAHASGLNLVNASHVLLCEPLLNTAIELQAIARVHRIGQQHETTVWLFIVEGTVEESIYELSVRKRLAHMGGSRDDSGTDRTSDDDISASLERANAMEMQLAQLSKLMAKGADAGEEVDQSDVWTCLFGNRQNRAPSGTTLLDDPDVRRLVTADAAEQRQA